jgi:DNA primase
MVSPSTIEQIRNASDIVDVIGGALPLKRAGANFVAICPFHKEKSPSFNVNPQKQIFHCFGCHKGGDVFTFIQEYESISFIEAVRRLAERARIPIQDDDAPGQQQSRFIKETLLQIHEQIAQRWHHVLLNDAAGEPGRQYLAKRHVPIDAIKLFRLGFAPDAWDDTVNWAKSKKFELSAVEQGGLVIRKEGDTRFYDRFRGRLMFPICDEQSRVIGFSGRIISGDEKTAKYVNSPETPIFTKGKVFFGLDKSKRALLDKQFAIVCEGQLDLIACFMGGVQNVVAPQGTAFTAEHARILKRYVEEVVLCFDSDTAGQTAAVRVLDSLLGTGLAIRVATIPSPHDPDSFIRANGSAAFQQLIDSAQGFFDFYLNRLCADHDVTSDKGQTAVVKAMAAAVQKTANAVLIDRYAQKTALRLGVTPEAVRHEFKRSTRPSSRAPENAAPAETTETSPEPRPSTHEFWLLKLTFLNDELANWARKHLDLAWVQHRAVREILSAWLEPRAPHGDTSAASLLAQVENPASRSLVTAAIAETHNIPNAEQQLRDVVLRLRNLAIDKQIAALSHRASDPKASDEQRIQYLREQQQLRLAKREPLAPRIF